MSNFIPDDRNPLFTVYSRYSQLIPNKNIIYTNFDNWFFYFKFGLYYISYYDACENFGY